uniref:Uncharacterized protein n=1 Tax=viral metagenome TaxID=1070528 RepID=A0A6C0I9M2_9ZZZZ
MNINEIKNSKILNKDTKYIILSKFYQNQIKDLLHIMSLDISRMYNKELKNQPLYLKKSFTSFPKKISMNTQKLFNHVNGKLDKLSLQNLFYISLIPRGNYFLDLDVFNNNYKNNLYCFSSIFNNIIIKKFEKYTRELYLLKTQLKNLE